MARLTLEVGEKIRDAREAAGITQRDFPSHVDEPGSDCPPRGRPHESYAQDTAKGRSSPRHDDHGQSGSATLTPACAHRSASAMGDSSCQRALERSSLQASYRKPLLTITARN